MEYLKQRYIDESIEYFIDNEVAWYRCYMKKLNKIIGAVI